MITAQMTAIARWALQTGLYLDIQSRAGIPSMVTALAAGALSFLSPCVFPLVPAYLGYLSGHVIIASQREIADQVKV
jgi:cytochrome c-type biogenesis protein